MTIGTKLTIELTPDQLELLEEFLEYNLSGGAEEDGSQQTLATELALALAPYSSKVDSLKSAYAEYQKKTDYPTYLEFGWSSNG